MSAVTASAALARRPDVYSVEVDGEAVLLHETDHQLHRLNVSAALLWSCLDGEATLEVIARDISDEVELPYDQVLDETLEVASRLLEQQLVQVGA